MQTAYFFIFPYSVCFNEEHLLVGGACWLSMVEGAFAVKMNCLWHIKVKDMARPKEIIQGLSIFVLHGLIHCFSPSRVFAQRGGNRVCQVLKITYCNVGVQLDCLSGKHALKINLPTNQEG